MTETWKRGLFEVGLSSCCKSTCCPCIVYSENEGKLSTGTCSHPFISCAVCTGVSLSLSYFFNIPWIVGSIPFLYAQRSSVRTKYGIDEGAFTTLCISCFCQPCSLAQMEHELKIGKQNQQLIAFGNTEKEQ